jgi:glycine/D-amino acid oxidase-like deaminating enzyme
MWQAKAASLWPYKLVCWVLEDLLTRFGFADGEGRVGFNLQTNTPVTHLQRLDSSSSSPSESPSTWVVHTPRGQVAARHVLLASNAHTSYLLPSFSDLIVPVRGQVTALVPKDGEPAPELTHTYVFLAEPLDERHNLDDYLVQRPAPTRELIFGGGRDFSSGPTVGVSNDDETDPGTSKHLRSILAQVLDLGDEGKGEVEDKEMDATYEWTGIMGFSRDGNPWVGPVPESMGGDVGSAGDRGLWICAGYTGHGMPQAALCAKAVVDTMAGASIEDVDLPSAFVLSEERIERARRSLDEVRVADTKGIGLFDPLDLESAYLGMTG